MTITSLVDDEAFLRDYRNGVAWDIMTRKYHCRRSNLNKILTEYQEPPRPPLHDGGRSGGHYWLELADGREAKIRM